MSDRVVVVGAGVVGLSCALRLLEAGHRVDVLARDLPLETTSSVAAARLVPLPRPAAGQGHRLGPGDVRRAGAPGCRRDDRRGDAPRDRAAGRGDARPLVDRGRAGAGARATASAVRRRVVVRGAGGRDAAAIWRWLHARVEEAGGTVTRLAMAHLPEGPLVVNCSGLGARAAGRRPVGDAGARPGGRGRAVRARGVVAGRGRSDVRHPAQQRHRARRDGGRGGVGPPPRCRRRVRHPAPRDRAGAGAVGGARAPAQGGSAPGPTRHPARAGRRRDPLLRPRRRGRHPFLGVRRRGRHLAYSRSRERSRPRATGSRFPPRSCEEPRDGADRDRVEGCAP